MDPDSELKHVDCIETILPSLDGDPANGVASKDIVLDSTVGISARFYLPAGVDPGKKLSVVVSFHGARSWSTFSNNNKSIK
jgi:dipeptidyl aminopeptidase/acylaminoacyl peptidase